MFLLPVRGLKLAKNVPKIADVSNVSTPKWGDWEITNQHPAQEISNRFFHKIFPQDFPARFSHKIFPSWILIGWLPITLFQMLNFHQSLSFLNWLFPLFPVLQNFPRRFFHKIFLQEFPTRFSRKNFPQDFPTRLSCKIFPSWTYLFL